MAAKRRKIIEAGSIEVLNFNETAITTFKLGSDISPRSGTTGVQPDNTGTEFHPTGVYVTLAKFDSGDLTLAREEVLSERLLAPGIMGIFTVFKQGARVENVLTAVHERAWQTFIRGRPAEP